MATVARRLTGARGPDDPRRVIGTHRSPSLTRRGFGRGFAALSLLTACARRSAGPTSTAAWGRFEKYQPDPRVGQYVSSAWTFETSTFWIAGPEGLVLVDTQFLPRAGLEAADVASHLTGQSVVTAFVLHANPDKFNGTTALQRKGVEVLTSQQVLDAMPAVHKIRVASFYERYKPDYPLEMPRPTVFGDRTTQLRRAGIDLTAHTLGPGCSEAHVVLQFEDQIFVGDLVANEAHSWLEIGRTDEWIARIDELSAMKPRLVHPGRGRSGGPELLVAQRAYLEEVVALVAAEKPSGPPRDDALARVRAELERRHPSYRFPVFLEIGLPAEWRRQAAAAAS
jgi:glyoxylase-like metal-dependent hydrolase (beta-lactamase superfamily II)